MNLSKYRNYSKSNVKPGFKVGGSANYAFSEMFELKSSLYFTTKGARHNEKKDTVSMKVNQQYVEFSVTPALRMELFDITDIFFFGGPYVAYGIGGNVKTTVKKTGEVTNRDTFDEFGYKRWDAGLLFGFEVVINRFIAGVDFTVGFVNLKKNVDVKNLNTSINFGYKF